jgi:hypothetical protein
VRDLRLGLYSIRDEGVALADIVVDPRALARGEAARSWEEFGLAEGARANAVGEFFDFFGLS